MGSQEGRGPQTEKHLPQSPFTDKFCQMTTFALVSIQLISPWCHGTKIRKEDRAALLKWNCLPPPLTANTSTMATSNFFLYSLSICTAGKVIVCVCWLFICFVLCFVPQRCRIMKNLHVQYLEYLIHNIKTMGKYRLRIPYSLELNTYCEQRLHELPPSTQREESLRESQGIQCSSACVRFLRGYSYCRSLNLK